MNSESLIGRINQVQDVLQAQAAHAVNLSLTARNWLVGYYIVEFEQQGEDRAKYGDNLLNNIAKGLSRKGLEARRLREYRQFYRVYPQIGENVIDYLQKNSVTGLSINDSQIWRLPTAKLQVADNQSNTIRQTASAKSQEHGSLQDEIWRLPTTGLVANEVAPRCHRSGASSPTMWRFVVHLLLLLFVGVNGVWGGSSYSNYGEIAINKTCLKADCNMAKIIVQNTEISIVSFNNEDYISLTDMAKSQFQEYILFRWLSLKSTLEYLGEWEMLYNPVFNSTEFGTIKNMAGSNNFVLSVKTWIEKTGAIGIVSKAGSC